MTDSEKRLGAEAAGQVTRLLRNWFRGAEAGPGTDPDALPDWLESAGEPNASRLLSALAECFELYRRDQWVQYATSTATVWARWTGGELERPTYLINQPASPGNNRLRLRREAPFGPQEIVAFLAAFADAEEAGRLQDRKAAALRGALLDTIREALLHVRGTPPDGDDMLGPLHRLHQQRKGDQIHASAVRRLTQLDQPCPTGLRECLQQLLMPREEVEGCLTRAYQLRLFCYFAEVAEPLLPREVFETSRAAVETLRGQIAPDADYASLRAVSNHLAELGRFARRTRPVLAGPSAGDHRRWVQTLFDNFERLGELAHCMLGEALPPSAEPETKATAEEPGPSIPAAAITIATPDPQPLPREPSPEEMALAALAAANPVAEQFLTLATLAEDLLHAVQGSWRDAEEALKSLQYPGNRFRQKLLRAAQAPAEEQTRQIRDAARQLADEFVNKIRRLDALLPGTGACPPSFKGPNHLPPQAREQLTQKIKTLRDRVFHVMWAHGGYEEYQVVVGDSVRKHGQVLDDVTYVSGPRLRPDEIVQILEPGYVRRREDGKQELIRSPKVLVAR